MVRWGRGGLFGVSERGGVIWVQGSHSLGEKAVEHQTIRVCIRPTNTHSSVLVFDYYFCLFLLSHFEIVFLLFPHIHTLCRENKDLVYFAAVNWTAGWSGRRSCSPTESGFSPGFFSVLSPMEFGFLAAVASGLLSWGHFISSNIIDLITQILFKVNWAGRWHHWIQ